MGFGTIFEQSVLEYKSTTFKLFWKRFQGVFPFTVYCLQSERMPVLEEAGTMDYVTNHNMINMAMTIFKTLIKVLLWANSFMSK